MSFLYHIRIACLVTILVNIASCKKDTKTDLKNNTPSSIYSSAKISVLTTNGNILGALDIRLVYIGINILSTKIICFGIDYSIEVKHM